MSEPVQLFGPTMLRTLNYRPSRKPDEGSRRSSKGGSELVVRAWVDLAIKALVILYFDYFEGPDVNFLFKTVVIVRLN